MNFISITDNTSETYYINKSSIAYLKESSGGNTPKPIYKIVLKNDKHIIIPNIQAFIQIRDELCK